NTNSSARILISETVNSGNNSVEQFYKKTLQYLLIHLRDANRTGRASLMALLNEFPMQFAYQPYLFKLEYFLYLYYHKAIPANTRFADFHIPEDLASLQRECVYYYNSIPEVNAVIDSNLMERTVFRIKHFHSISYLSGEDIKLLQNDLINLLDLYEEILQTGKNKMGCNWNIWYSSLSVTSTNMLLEYNQNSLLSLWVFVTEPVFLQNNCNLNHLFSHHYSTLLRFSALLTHSNEIICHNVSRTMREQIDQLTEF
ncbi:MAG: hypothetical protein LBS25_01985, partial [Candidatus Symbiothrix sp.]|nr:hypothetical protein [Candidatus Symbiothrix sp.]